MFLIETLLSGRILKARPLKQDKTALSSMCLDWDARPNWSWVLIILMAVLATLMFAGCSATETEKMAWDQAKKAHSHGMGNLDSAMSELGNSTVFPQLREARADFQVTGQALDVASMGVEEPTNPVAYSRPEAEYWIRAFASERKRNLELRDKIRGMAASVGGNGFSLMDLLAPGGVLVTMGGFFLREFMKRKQVEKATGVTARKVQAEKTIKKEELKT